MRKNRQYSMDVLRIFSMCGIVMLHFLGKGGMLDSTRNIYNFDVVWFLEICAYCSVDIFALLSGYLNSEKKEFSAYRFLELIMCTFLYSVLITGIFKVYRPEVFQEVSLLESVFPPLKGRYWYIVNFLPLMLLYPYINLLLSDLTDHQHKQLCFISVLLFSVIPFLFNVDFFKIHRGYSFLWLSVGYLVGTYLRRFKRKYIHNSTYLVIYSICAVVLTVLKHLEYRDYLTYKQMNNIISYNSTVVLCMAVCMFRFFEGIDMNKCAAWIKKVIKKLSLVSFDVYILHGHILVFNYIICDRFVEYNNHPIVQIPILVCASVALCYIILSCIGFIRIWLFSKCSFLFNKKLINTLSFKLDSNCNSDD